MFKALLRFLLFLIPATILRGCAYIIFDNVELVAVDLNWRKLKRKKTKAEEKRNILLEYLEDCHKRNFEEDKGGKNGKT